MKLDPGHDRRERPARMLDPIPRKPMVVEIEHEIVLKLRPAAARR